MKFSKMINDTLSENGRWSMKRVSAFAAFWLAIVYEFILGAVLKMDVHEYVWEALMIYAGYVITGSIVDKKFINKAEPPPPTDVV